MNGYHVTFDGAIHRVMPLCGWCGPDCRPVVVIDPEDREQAGRLLDAYTNCVKPYRGEEEPDDWRTDRMQGALRSLVAPKPAEPTGKYAEVEDHRGWLYFRDPNGLWRLASNVVTPRRWDDIAAVKVLSEGVLA